MFKNQKGFSDTILVTILGGVIGSLFIGGVFVWKEIDKQNTLNSFLNLIKFEKEEENKKNQVDIFESSDLCKSLYYDEQISICGDYYLVTPLPFGTMDLGVDYYDNKGSHLAICGALRPFDSEEERLENFRKCNLYSKEKCEVVIGSCVDINLPEYKVEEKNTNVSKVDCEKLNQEQCYNSKNCKGSFGSSFCNGELCTSDWKYTGCIEMSEEEYSKEVLEKELCENTNGFWSNQDDKYLGSCNCGWRDENGERVGYYFIKGKGCNNLEDICEFREGQFYEPGQLLCDTINDYHLGCSTIYNEEELPVYNRIDICICPNGDVMDTNGTNEFCDYNHEK